MQSIKSASFTAPSVSARVVQFDNNGNLAPYCVVENKDDANGIALNYQESDDGSTWAPIADTYATVNPGASNGQSVVSTKRFIALFAGGNAVFDFSVNRQLNGSPANLGAA